MAGKELSCLNGLLGKFVYERLWSLVVSFSHPFIWVYFPSPYRAGWMRRPRGQRATAPSQAWQSWDMMLGPSGGGGALGEGRDREVRVGNSPLTWETLW